MENQPGKIYKEAMIIDEEKIKLFGNFIQQARMALDPYKSRTKIALFLGVDPSTVEKWENGITFPKEDNLKEIAMAYGLDLKELKVVLEISQKAHEVAVESRHHKFVPKNVNPDADVIWSANPSHNRRNRTVIK